MSTTMRKLNKSQLRAWTLNYLKTKQGGLCAICGLPIETGKQQGNKTDYVADHDHSTGEIRGVLHRACNGAEGKVASAAGRWGAKSMQYENIVPWVEKLIAYWKKPGTGLIYPTHKTAEELKAASLLKRRTSYARKQAALKVKQEKQ